MLIDDCCRLCGIENGGFDHIGGCPETCQECGTHHTDPDCPLCHIMAFLADLTEEQDYWLRDELERIKNVS